MPAKTDHPCFSQPENGESLIWRYMDFTKFVSLLESDSLFFSRADCFEDVFEGSVPKGNVLNRGVLYGQIPKEKRENAISQMIEFRKSMRLHTYINCWHMNNHESAAMWRLYAATNEAVAICTRYSNLASVLDDDTYLGCVNYIDYETSTIPENNSFWPFMFKRMSFAHEVEVRAVVQDLEKNLEAKGGLLKAIDIKELIEKVYVAPNAPSWYVDLVSQVVNRYGLPAKVIQSSLSEEPVY